MTNIFPQLHLAPQHCDLYSQCRIVLSEHSGTIIPSKTVARTTDIVMKQARAQLDEVYKTIVERITTIITKPLPRRRRKRKMTNKHSATILSATKFAGLTEFTFHNLNIGESVMRTSKLIAIFLAVFAITAQAESATELKATIEAYGGGGLTAVVSQPSLAGGTDVTVTGAVTNKTTGLMLNIDRTINVIWKASLTGSVTSANCLISISSGSFEVQSDGKIELTSSQSLGGICNGGNTNIRGEVLATAGGVAIRNVSGTLTMNDGIVFGYGTTAADIINGTYSQGGNNVIIAYNKPAGNPTYTIGTSNDIFKLPATATAVWSNKDGKAGIDYANNTNTGFIAISGITVNNPSSSSAQTSPSSSSVGGSSSSGDPTPILLPQIASGNILIKPIANAIVLENLPKNARVEMYSLQGKRIYSHNSVNSQILQIQVYTKGMYIVKISLGSETRMLRVAVM